MKNKRNKDIDKDSMCPNCAHYNSWISNGKKHLNLIYTIPKDCVVDIPEKEMTNEAL